MPDIDLLLEAERRGLLPPDKKGLLDEARRRGIVVGGGGEEGPKIDFARPEGDVYADIQKLPEDQREKALNKWADFHVAQRRKTELEQPAGAVQQRIQDTVASTARGIPFLGTYLDEAGGWASGKLHEVSGGAVGRPQDMATALYRARDRAIAQEHPVESIGGSIVGGFASAGPVIKAISAARGATAAPEVAKQAGRVVQGIKTGVAVGVPIGGVAAHGEGTGGILDPSRLEKVPAGMAVGGGLGVVLPPVIGGVGWLAGTISDAITPQLARLGAKRDSVLEALRSRLSSMRAAPGQAEAAAAQPVPGSAGAAAVGLPQAYNPGAEAAADQILANQLSRAGVGPNQLSRVVGEAEDAARFYSNSFAQNKLAPVDVDPALARLAGSLVRQSPEADRAAINFIYGRQTGLTPRSGPLPEASGIPTRLKLSPPDPDAPPMGQYERVKDALKRALLIKDKDFHGHAASAYRTHEMIMDRAREQADRLYGIAYKVGEKYDLKPTLEPVLQKWQALATEYPKPVGDAIVQFMANFNTRAGNVVADLKAFDLSKRYADKVIDGYLRSPDGHLRYLGGRLNEMKKDLLAAIDNVPRLGKAYSNARNIYSSEMELRDALQLGQSVFKEGSEFAVDQFRALTTDGEKKLFRLGLLSSFEDNMGRMARTHDVTKIFDNPRIQQILEAVIPRHGLTATGRAKLKGGETAVFYNRPERFGRYLDTEQSFVSTNKEVLGGSPTIKRKTDDEAYGLLTDIADKGRAAIAGGPVNLMFDISVRALSKVFGYRADTAAALARKLFTADPAEQQRVWDRVAARFGPDRFQQFVDLVVEEQAALTAIGANMAGRVP